MAVSISASVGFGFSLSKAVTAMIIPDWQYPHCGTSCSSQACCTALSMPLTERLSIVATCLPAAALTGMEQERTAIPSICTVRNAATEFGAGHAEVVSQHPKQWRIGLYVNIVILTIDDESDHCIPPMFFFEIKETFLRGV